MIENNRKNDLLPAAADDDSINDMNGSDNHDQQQQHQDHSKHFSTIQIHNSFSSIINLYDAFIIDQWGVMHNGDKAMDGAIECVKELYNQGKKLCILSNTSSSEQECLERLQPLGFNPKWFATHGGAITSGDIATNYIKEKYGHGGCNANKNKRKTKALVIAWKHPIAPSSRDFLNRIGNDTIELVSSVDDDDNLPDIIILHGIEIILGGSKERNYNDNNDVDDEEEQEEISLGDFVMTGNIENESNTLLKSTLIKCSKLNIPMLCIDPDLITINPDGSIYYMPGTIAKYYEHELNGNVIYFGKPTKYGFQQAIKRLVTTVPKHFGRDSNISDDNDSNNNNKRNNNSSSSSSSVFRICHIGDSIHHDIIGANNTSCDVVDGVVLDTTLVLGGVHRVELGNEFGKLPSKQRISNFLEGLAKEQQQQERDGSGGRSSSFYPTHIAPLLKL